MSRSLELAKTDTYIREVMDALWNAPLGLGLSPRQLGALEHLIVIAWDHRLHRRWPAGPEGRCLICEAFEQLQVTTAEATP